MEKYRISDRLSVRSITPDDTDLIVLWRNKPRVVNNFLVHTEVTREAHMNWMRTRVATGEVRQFILEETTDGHTRPIGSVYIRDIDMDTLSAEYGIFIGEDDALGHGYGNDAVNWAVGYARNMGLKVFVLRVLSDNIPAIKSYEQAGFTQTKIHKDYMDGRDLVFMEIRFADN